MDDEQFLSALEDIQADATELQAVIDPKSIFGASLRIAELAARMCEHHYRGELVKMKDDFEYLKNKMDQLQEIVSLYRV